MAMCSECFDEFTVKPVIVVRAVLSPMVKEPADVNACKSIATQVTQWDTAPFNVSYYNNANSTCLHNCIVTPHTDILRNMCLTV